MKFCIEQTKSQMKCYAPKVAYVAVTRERHQRNVSLSVHGDQWEEARLSVHFQGVRVCTRYTDISKLFLLQYTHPLPFLIRPSYSVIPRA